MVSESVAFLEKVFGKAPCVAVVLGTGWNKVADTLSILNVVDYSSVPGFADTSVKGHRGKLLLADVGGRRVIFLQGRIHYYEGYGMDAVVYPTMTVAYWGVKKIILTNAAGGISDSIDSGDVVVIKDHISIWGVNPLIGIKGSFVDMVGCYDIEMQDLAESAAKEVGFNVHRGVYVYLTGPSFETPAEIKLLKGLGADVVGMSTVPEAIVARRFGMKVAAISFVSNKAASESVKVRHEDVLRVIGDSSDRLSELIGRFLADIKCT